jgi:hypothetical protein
MIQEKIVAALEKETCGRWFKAQGDTHVHIPSLLFEFF